MIDDLRTYLEILRLNDELLTIDREVDPKYEMATVLHKLDLLDKPAGFFRRVKGYNIPVVGNLLGSLRRIALALNTDEQNILQALTRSMQNPIKPIRVDSGPIQENTITDPEEIDVLKQFPILTHSMQDVAPYITCGIWLVKDPETGRRNAAYVRSQVVSRNRLYLHLGSWRHTQDFYQKAEKQGIPLECSVAIGVDPAIELAAAIKVPNDELEIAGSIRSAPVRLVDGETINIESIANAEIVIEGHILPNIREHEGPFGEFTGHVSGQYEGVVFEITCLRYRQNPIYRALYGGSNEHIMMGNVVPRLPSLYQTVQRLVPSVRDVDIPKYGAGYIGVISIEKKFEGEAKNAIIAAWSSHNNLKYIIVVDHDVNIHDSREVLWAMATRCLGKNKFSFITESLGNTVDPSRREDGTVTKVGIDATVPLGSLNKNFQRIRFANDDILKIEDYLQ